MGGMEETPQPRQELIRLRIDAGHSQKVMAHRIGIGHSTLENAEAGERIRLRTARRISEYWERSVAELFPEVKAPDRRDLFVPANLPERNGVAS